MTEEVNDQQEVSNPEETQDSNLEQVAPSEELTKAQELANNYKIRAEKAERALKAQKPALKEEVVAPKNDLSGMSLKDIRALQDVPDEDVEDVTEFAKFKGISIAEAKKSQVMQTLLRTKAEERKTAEVANTSTSRRSSKKGNDDSLLEDFGKNRLPNSKEEMDRLVAAQLAAKKASLKR